MGFDSVVYLSTLPWEAWKIKTSKQTANEADRGGRLACDMECKCQNGVRLDIKKLKKDIYILTNVETTRCQVMNY